MRATELRAVRKLTSADVLQLGNDPAFYNVVGIERSSDEPHARCKVTLRSADGLRGVMLVRAGHEQVLIVPCTTSSILLPPAPGR